MGDRSLEDLTVNKSKKYFKRKIVENYKFHFYVLITNIQQIIMPITPMIPLQICILTCLQLNNDKEG